MLSFRVFLIFVLPGTDENRSRPFMTLFCSRFVLALFLLGPFCAAQAQKNVVHGIIRDQQTGERVPFASVILKVSGDGKLADSAGTFRIFLPLDSDTLVITSVGYAPYKLFLKDSMFRDGKLDIIFDLLPGAIDMGVVVRAKGNRGLFLWRKIVKNKPENDRYRFDNFSYELYNKLELDLNNVDREKMEKIRLLRSFSFIMDNIDSSEGVAFLPVYITETISDYYFQKEPKKYREVIRAVNVKGSDNESVAKLLGGMDQNINVYNNFIPVFDKQFVSPLSDKGDNYYNYKIADTQYVSGKRLIHFLFSGKHKGNSTFEGDCWVQDSTYGIQKITLRLSKDANLNYVNNLVMVQEYKLVDNSTWFVSKDIMVAEINPLGNNKLSFIARKTTSYKSVQVETPSVIRELSKNTKAEEVILLPSAMERSKEYWTENRFEPLSKNEQGIYQMIDTLMQLPKFRTYTRAVNFIGTGYLDVGTFQIGPWQNRIYSNQIEGLRLRFDLGTNSKFSKKWNFHGYAAYGFGDGKLKGGFDGLYLFQKEPRIHLYGLFFNDFDYGQNYFDEVSSDNLFAVAVRKQDVPIKYIRLKQQRLDYLQEWKSGFSTLLSVQNRQYNPVLNLPGKNSFPGSSSSVFNAFDVSLRLRFAYQEKFIGNTFSRISLGSPFPIVEVKYTKGISGAFDGGHDYHKLNASVSNYSNIAPYGSISYNLFAGRTFATLPYMFLDIAPGNEIHYYNSRAYNMMNKYEYVHDRFAGFNIEHHFGSGIFRFVPLTRKLKFRQFWTARALLGGLSEANRQLNFTGHFPFRSLDGEPYVELGTGVDNIFKLIRIDFVWKVLPGKSRPDDKQFGIFGSFRFSF